ncbi:sulfite exporter TauE/SafE family protein [Clostridium sp. JNZ J1-5]
MKIILIFLIGIAAGFINTLAGGGSLLTVPMLIFLGLPSAVANGTNRIAVAVENIVAAANFKNKGYFDMKFGLMIGIPSVIGSILGAKAAINLPDELFNKILGVIMVIVVIFIIWEPQKRLLPSKFELTKTRQAILMILFFCVGIYGGLIQGGIGFIIIIVLSLMTNFSLVKINSLKVFVMAMYMLSSLSIFIINGKVHWILGVTLAIGNGIGGYLGSSFAVKNGDKFVKIALIIAVIIMALKLLGVFK